MPVASGSIAFLGAARFQGYWNATTNLASGSGQDGSVSGPVSGLFATGTSDGGGYSNETNLTASIGHYWQVTGSGTHTIEAENSWRVNDWIIYSGSHGEAGTWAKLAFEDTIASIVLGDISGESVFHLTGTADQHVLFITGASDATVVQSGSNNFTFNYVDSSLHLTGNLHIADDQKIYFGANNDASISYDETTTNSLIFSASGKPLTIMAGDSSDLLLSSSDDLSVEAQNTLTLKAASPHGAGGGGTITFNVSGSTKMQIKENQIIIGDAALVGASSIPSIIYNGATGSLATTGGFGQAWIGYPAASLAALRGAGLFVQNEPVGRGSSLDVSGSTNFGNRPEHQHKFTGSIEITGSNGGTLELYGYDAKVDFAKFGTDTSIGTSHTTLHGLRFLVENSPLLELESWKGPSIVNNTGSIKLNYGKHDIDFEYYANKSGSSGVNDTFAAVQVSASNGELHSNYGINLARDKYLAFSPSQDGDVNGSPAGGSIRNTTTGLGRDRLVVSGGLGGVSVSGAIIDLYSLEGMRLWGHTNNTSAKISLNGDDPSLFGVDSDSKLIISGTDRGMVLSSSGINIISGRGQDSVVGGNIAGHGDIAISGSDYVRILAGYRLALSWEDGSSVGADRIYCAKDADGNAIMKIGAETRLLASGGIWIPTASYVFDNENLYFGEDKKSFISYRESLGGTFPGSQHYLTISGSNSVLGGLAFSGSYIDFMPERGVRIKKDKPLWFGDDPVTVGAPGDAKIFFNKDVDNVLVISGSDNGGVVLSGSSVTVDNSLLPTVDDTYNLGSSGKRWAHAHMGDLHLKNERGSWTIIEEADYLSITNNKTNKRYKFVLEEID